MAPPQPPPPIPTGTDTENLPRLALLPCTGILSPYPPYLSIYTPAIFLYRCHVCKYIFISPPPRNRPPPKEPCTSGMVTHCPRCGHSVVGSTTTQTSLAPTSNNTSQTPPPTEPAASGTSRAPGRAGPAARTTANAPPCAGTPHSGCGPGRKRDSVTTLAPRAGIFRDGGCGGGGVRLRGKMRRRRGLWARGLRIGGVFDRGVGEENADAG
ncbi:hypothetical protein EX30DRAFT_365522 [Ascodesmis nigricans]|uniref:Uncharacterized protein n=1 Tax=Ascodesmis nigricans TaxID=341454 RepID=A0A4V3SI74_9PEZI|nr:hypothetical protein EX30DRAFT_365522 [Ascodesmis nigricans]